MENKTKNTFQEKFVGIIQKHWIILLLFLLVGGWFYWFQWRPEVKREQCLQKAREEHEEAWNKHCERLGREKECGLSKEAAEFYRKSWEESKDRCVSVWK